MKSTAKQIIAAKLRATREARSAANVLRLQADAICADYPGIAAHLREVAFEISVAADKIG